jgi:hypothetical protein
LKQAFLNRSVLLVLDDCWDAEVAAQFAWVDTNTNSKILISSRVRDVLDGGQIVDVSVPTARDAVQMLLGAAGLDVGALQGRKEVAQIADMCKRLPLTIGVAGKLIRQTANGGSMSTSTDWADVLDLLAAELNDPLGDLSIEESVIRASIKAIPKKVQKQVTRLFTAFALVPEDTQVSLDVLGLVYDACGGCTDAKPISRLHVRQYLKVLLDRSLVLGTVDRPQLHDVMLEYVSKQFAGKDAKKEAHRRLVDLFRAADRSTVSGVGLYLQLNGKHHVTEAYDEAWAKGAQAIGWLDDHLDGVQDLIAISTASLLPAEALAKEAEAAGMWWQAALRWSATAHLKMFIDGVNATGVDDLKRAVSASANVVVSGTAPRTQGVLACTQNELDLFELHILKSILVSWDIANIEIYGERLKQVAQTKAAQAKPTDLFGVALGIEWFPAMLSGDKESFANVCWNMSKKLLDLDANTDGSTIISEEEMANAKMLSTGLLFFVGDTLLNTPGFNVDDLGEHGEKIVEAARAYVHEEYHSMLCIVGSLNNWFSGGEAFWLTMQFGRVKDALVLLKRQSADILKLMVDPHANGYHYTLTWAAAILSSVLHLHGLNDDVRQNIAALGLTFKGAEEWACHISMRSAGTFTRLEWKWEDGAVPANGGLNSTVRMLWQIKCIMIVCCHVAELDAIAFLHTLPADDDVLCAVSNTMGTHDHSAIFGFTQIYWLALACEKVRMYEEAIRFANFQLGYVCVHARALALSCSSCHFLSHNIVAALLRTGPRHEPDAPSPSGPKLWHCIARRVRWPS